MHLFIKQLIGEKEPSNLSVQNPLFIDWSIELEGNVSRTDRIIIFCDLGKEVEKFCLWSLDVTS